MTSRLPRQCGLLDLPQEVLFQITSHLDSRSATSLSTVCLQLQPSAESRVWESIGITQSDIFGTDTTSRLSSFQSPPFGENEVEEEEEKEDDLSDSLAKTHSNIWALRSQSLIFHLNHLLERQSWRKGFVKRLDLQLRLEIPLDLAKLLKSLPSLREFVLSFPTASSNTLANQSLREFITTLQLFQSLEKSPLVRLKMLKVTVTDNWSLTVQSMLKSAPGIQVLHIGSQIGDRGYHQRLEDVQEKLGSLPCLKVLSVEDMQPSFTNTLDDVVKAAPYLKEVSLRDQVLSWRPDKQDGLLKSMSKLKGLKELETSSRCIDAITSLDGWTEVESLIITWTAGMLKESEIIGRIIPPLPRLRRYQINLSTYASSHHAWQHLAEPRLGAMSTLISRLPLDLVHAPSLGIIQCPGYETSQNSLMSNGDIPKLDWKDPLFQGIIVYSYENEKGDELVHCRSKVRSQLETRSPLVDIFAGWEEHGYYNWKPIPTRVLAGVYGITGTNLKDQPPGRGLCLAHKGWDLLSTWERQDEKWS
ncbi:uncharacterized protein IL334_005577 [Kwoniella shivajii]|uniref:F-box domain-containing protein n=1 Tax=Kwoniella shivajii TaxID=564305 RepID=A0ABZ1D5L0_9TREE|nr:hypothetical protein IL334_005577 [Kwoniella shivajii]